MWTLKWLTENGWVQLAARPSGDACKTYAREHERSQSQSNQYRIYAPDERLKWEGKRMHAMSGPRMMWTVAN